MRSIGFGMVWLLAPAAALHLATGGHLGTRIEAAPRPSACTMGLFDGLKQAFANDETLGDRGSAGLSKEKTKRVITWVGPKGQKKTSQVVAGQRLRDVARGSGIPIKYDCQEGTCKTCEAKMGSGKVKLCVAKAVSSLQGHTRFLTRMLGRAGLHCRLSRGSHASYGRIVFRAGSKDQPKEGAWSLVPRQFERSQL